MRSSQKIGLAIFLILSLLRSVSAFSNTAQGGKTAGPAFSSGVAGPLAGAPGKDIKQIGSSFLDKNHAICGQDCLYHKATSNISYQMDWIQKKIDRLKSINASGSPVKLKQMNDITEGFCSKLGLEFFRISHPGFSHSSLSSDECLKTYVTFMENWLWKARASLAENEAHIRELRCDSGGVNPADKKRCSELLTADLEELYQLSSGVRFTQVPEFMTAKDIAEMSKRYSNKESLARLYQVSGDDFENMSAVDYVKQKLVLNDSDCNVLKQSAKRYKKVEGTKVDRPDEAVFEACKNSKENLELLLNSKGASSSLSSSEGSVSHSNASPSSTRIKLKDLVEQSRATVEREFSGEVKEEEKSSLRKLYDEHHDENVISLMGSYDKKAKKSWIKVTKAPEDEVGGEDSPSSSKKKEVEIHEIDIGKARRELGAKPGELRSSPPVFMETGGHRKAGSSSLIQQTMQSGQVEFDDQKRVKPVNDSKLIHRLDEVSGDE